MFIAYKDSREDESPLSAKETESISKAEVPTKIFKLGKGSIAYQSIAEIVDSDAFQPTSYVLRDNFHGLC